MRDDVTIESFGSTSLVQIGTQFFLRDSAGDGPLLKDGGSPFAPGEFDQWTPIGAERTANGYQIAWKFGSSNGYVIWNTDANGNHTNNATGILQGADPTLEALENSFQQDLNGDGMIVPASATIDPFGVTRLVLVGNQFFLHDNAGNWLPIKDAGSPVVVGEFGDWTPIGAEQTANGFQIAWKLGASDAYVVWNTDAGGNHTGNATGVVPGSDLTLQELENSFHQDLNGDGRVGPLRTTIESSGVTPLILVGNKFFLNGLLLTESGNPVVTGEFGDWTPIAAEQTANGYQVAWKLGASDAYVIWNTDINGNHTGNATGVMSGSDPALEALESSSFHQDLNGDGLIAIESFGVTSLVQIGTQFVLRDSAGSGPVLKDGGGPVAPNEFDSWTPIGAERTAGGYQIAWQEGFLNGYVIWNTDANGNHINNATGILQGADPAFEAFENGFQQDLNGDGMVSGGGVIGTISGDTIGLVNLTITIADNPVADTASVSSGLNAPSLTFIGTPDAMTLGSGVATIDYKLAATSGVETVANFEFGRDLVDIDLMGTGADILRAYDTTVDGVHAIAIGGSADLAHGLVLLNMPTGQSAADLLADHTRFVDGHALIG